MFPCSPGGGNVSVTEQGAASLVSQPGFDQALVTVFYMHGYTETQMSESIAVVSRAFLRRGGYNFVLVDWSVFSVFPYIKAFYNVYQVHRPVASTIEAMAKAGMARERVWLVTHSMGSQLGGAVARELGWRLRRVTALDPAWPGFNLADIPSLSRDDAHLVDVIHTDAGFYGFATSVGHLDFWPNHGRRVQPGCPAILKDLGRRYCSHHMSWRLFAESVVNETAFPAKACASWRDFTEDKCGGAGVAYMGLLADKNKSLLQGDFYLTTNAEQPYGRWAGGLQAVEALHHVPAANPLVHDWSLVETRDQQ